MNKSTMFASDMMNSIEREVKGIPESTTPTENMATIARNIGCQVEEAIHILSAIETIVTGKTIGRHEEGPSCLYGDLTLTENRLGVLIKELYYLSEIIGACPDACRSSM